jgi:hypothetical protein
MQREKNIRVYSSFAQIKTYYVARLRLVKDLLDSHRILPAYRRRVQGNLILLKVELSHFRLWKSGSKTQLNSE